jgi:hypothetical protein
MLWLVSWPERRPGERSRREHRIVLADTSGQAFVWIAKLKPLVLSVAQEVRVEPYRELVGRP